MRITSGGPSRSRGSTSGSGPGITWNCFIDDLTQNRAPNCRGGVQWEMGKGDLGEPNPWQLQPTDRVPLVDKQVGRIHFDVTKDVQAWIDGVHNYGWVLKIGTTKDLLHGDVAFWSREKLDGRPILTLEIRPPEE